jgi:hypothetical protein
MRDVPGTQDRRGRCGRVELVETLEHREGVFKGRAGVERRLKQAPCFASISAAVGDGAVVQQLLGLPLALGLRAWFRSKKSARVQMLMACSYCEAK